MYELWWVDGWLEEANEPLGRAHLVCRASTAQAMEALQSIFAPAHEILYPWGQPVVVLAATGARVNVWIHAAKEARLLANACTEEGRGNVSAALIT